MAEPKLSILSRTMVPLDVVREIFSTLPAKSLVRFRCMSKLICSFIDSREFIDLHLHHSLTSETNHHLIIRCEDRELPMETFMVGLNSLDRPLVKVSPPLHHTGRFSAVIFGSCDGLLALSKMNDANGLPWTRELAVWNPSTREYRMLPEVEQTDNHLRHFLGFGYDATADDYKVVFWQFHDNKSKGTLAVYSLRAGSWTKLITIDIPWCAGFDDTCGVFYMSSLHWLVSGWKDSHHWIASFNLEREEFELMTPLPYISREGKPKLSVFQGCLCVSYSFYEGTTRMAEVWMLEEYGLRNSLTKVFYIDGRSFFPVGYSLSHRKVLIKSTHRTGLLWCDLENGKYEELELHEGAPKLFSATMCPDSLVRLS